MEAGRKAAADYGANRYHGPKDEFDAATWKLDGTVEDLQLMYGVGRNWPVVIVGRTGMQATRSRRPATR